MGNHNLFYVLLQPLIGTFNLIFDLGEIFTAVDAMVDFNNVCLVLDLDLDFNLLNLVNSFYNYINYFFSIVDTIKEGFNFGYEQGYMILCSRFPDKIPSLPGKNPLSFSNLIVYLIHLYLFYTIINNVRKLVYLTFKFLCYLILPLYPNFTIKYLFYFDKQVQKTWSPLLKIIVTDANHYETLVFYSAIRRIAMSYLFMFIVDCIVTIFVSYLLGNYIHSRVVFGV
ncbi:MAG: hypothetical protein EOP34_01010 [Rickettsiales bacterium]|nr:MAG: hypothetical protein EOP34_01010 [Rickettsiales bacterium]